MVPAMISKDRGLKVDVEVGTLLVLRWASKFPNATRDALARSTRKLIAERIVLSKQNVETVPAAFYLSATWPTRRSRDRLKRLAEDYEQRAEKASHIDAANASAPRGGAAVSAEK